LIALIIVAGMILVLFVRPSIFYSNQVVIGQYTLAVTVVLAAAAILGGGTIWLSSHLRKEAKEWREETEQDAETVKNIRKEIEDLHSKIIEKKSTTEEEPQKLREIYFPEWEAGLNLAREIKRALETPKLANCKQCLGELARIFDRHSTLKAHTMRLFTAKEPREVKASAMTLFNMAPEWGKRIIESRLNFERSSASPNTDLIEFLSRLLGLWGQALKEE